MLDWAGGKLLVSNRLIKNSVSSEITSKGTFSTFFKIVGDSGPIRVEGGGGRVNLASARYGWPVFLLWLGRSHFSFTVWILLFVKRLIEHWSKWAQINGVGICEIENDYIPISCSDFHHLVGHVLLFNTCISRLMKRLVKTKRNRN